ncbi:MAG TPA: hypothetical protein VL326_17680 [Kofleriaceae bacterium]|nr:hypothetical protein [Kofleriaceae bacterium]
MRKLLVPLALSLGAMLSVVQADDKDNQPPPAATQAALRTPQALELRDAMRKLWEEHIQYTRNFIISTLGNLQDQKAVTERLLKNQDDIGNAIKPYYGDEAGQKLTKLLRDHILIAADVVKAAKANNKKTLAKQQERWSTNGKEIASFLAAANNSWQEKDLEAMLQKHLDLTTGEVVGRLTKDWQKDIDSYDAGHAHMLMFADALTEGIVKQFPNKFGGKQPAAARMSH